MCKFCGRYDLGEAVNRVKTESISVGVLKDALRLELWLMRNSEKDKNGEARLNVALTETRRFDDISSMNIPINYCPFCGEKL